MGCGKNEAETISESSILIEVEAPRTNGWSTEENIGTRCDQTIKEEGKDGLDMEVSTQPGSDTPTGQVTTRWTNLDDGITFRVIAYKCASPANITTANYAGYGDYKLSGITVQATKNLVLPIGTYTFVCYSYGNSTAIPAFNNSTTSVSATNGQNFMTCVKPNITINITGSKYTLSNIVFIHQCVQYRILAKAQSGRMHNITACSAILTLPANSATYKFTDQSFTTNAIAGSINVTWTNPKAMAVYSDYIYVLPQSARNITIKFNAITIGGKIFTNKNITPTVTINANGTYTSTVSFSTTEGYIVGGAMWANGNLIYSGGTYSFHSTTMGCSKANKATDYFVFNNPYPSNPELVSTWSDSRDPCRKVFPINTWKTPTVQNYESLLKAGVVVGTDRTTYGGTLILPFTSFMRFTSGYPHEPYFDFIGYYLSTSYLRCLQNNTISTAESSTGEILAFPVRCVRVQ